MFHQDNKMRRVEDRAEVIESVLARDTTLEGTLHGAYGVRIMGSVEGDVESGGRVKIERGGRVHGNIKAADVIVNGVLEGDIEAEGQIELGHESRMIGNIKAARIAIADGCFLRGDIKMFRKEDEPLRFVEKRAVKPANRKP